MPNHVINEIIFRGVSPETQDAILSKVVDKDGNIDFEILVPSPINIWCGSVGQVHEKTFRAGTHLGWARINWGTKWNAYSQRPIERTDDTLILRFETAWSPPYGWIVAVFNTFKMPFEHNWLDEGAERGVSGLFDYKAMGSFIKDPWRETPATDEMQKHLHMLLGVEAFEDEELDT